MKLIRMALIFSLPLSVSAISLENAFLSALKTHEPILQGKEKIKQSEEVMRQTRGASYPSINFEATHFMQPELNNAVAREFYPERQTTVGVNLKQPLFRGLRDQVAMKQRRALWASELQSQQEKKAQLFQEVATYFLQVLSYEKDIKNLQAQQELLLQRVNELARRAQRGESSSSEELSARAALAALVAEIQITKTQLKEHREQLSFLTALPVDIELESSERDRSLAPLDSYLQRIEKRKDVEQAKEKLKVAELETTFIRRGHLPSIDLTGNYYFARPDGFVEDIDWDVELKLTLPLFEGGVRSSQTREAQSKQQEALLELKRVERYAVSQVRSLYQTNQMRAEQLVVLKNALDLAKRNYEVLQRDFRRGLVRNIDVHLALNDFYTTQRKLDSAQFSADLEYIELQVATLQLPQSVQSAIEKED